MEIVKFIEEITDLLIKAVNETNGNEAKELRRAFRVMLLGIQVLFH